MLRPRTRLELFWTLVPFFRRAAVSTHRQGSRQNRLASGTSVSPSSLTRRAVFGFNSAVRARPASMAFDHGWDFDSPAGQQSSIVGVDSAWGEEWEGEPGCPYVPEEELRSPVTDPKGNVC